MTIVRAPMPPRVGKPFPRCRFFAACGRRAVMTVRHDHLGVIRVCQPCADTNPHVERVHAPCECGGLIRLSSGECDSCDNPKVFGA